MKYFGRVSDPKDLTTKEYVDGRVDEMVEVPHYGVCNTEAAKQAKVVAVSGTVTLKAGTFIIVKFTYAQTYNGAPTLNVNELGAVAVRRYGTTAAARYEWNAGEVLMLVYDGSGWLICDGGIATTTYYGVTKLSSSTSSTSEAMAATPKAVKAAYDLADAKQDKLTFDTSPTAGSANPVTSGGVYAALQNAGGKSYSRSFAASEWSGSSGNYTLSVLAESHGCGTAPMVQVFRLNGSSYETAEGYPSTGWKAVVDGSGNITLTAAASFAGRLVVR